jgi:hypothetical protein
MRLFEALQMLLLAGVATPRPRPPAPMLLIAEPEPIPILDAPGTPEQEARELRAWLDAEGFRPQRWHGPDGVWAYYLWHCDVERRFPVARAALRGAWGELEDGPIRIHAPGAAAPEDQDDEAVWSRERTLAWVQAQIASGDHPTQETIRTVSGRAKQTVSDWLALWERQGLIRPRRWAGKTKIIEPSTVGLRRAA